MVSSGHVMRRVALVLLTAALAASCGGGVGLDGNLYRDGSVAFRVGAVPEGWRPISVPGASLAWRDDAHAASIVVNGRCTGQAEDVPLTALRNHLVMGTTDREYAVEEVVPFDGREALHTTMRAKLDGVPMTYDLWVLKKDGCVYDFVYVAAPGAFERGAGAFRRFVSGFATVSAER
jgi:hypothetical protein